MNEKYKIVALFGPAGSGKDYIQKSIMKTIWGKTHLHEIISCTTRPPREGEIDGVNYNFLSRAEELLKKDLIEFAVFRNWWYGTPTEALDINKINIGVFNISGIDQLINKDYHNRIDCLPIEIIASDKIRLIRQLSRESNPDCQEICRRFETDKNDFLSIPFEYKVIENNTNENTGVLLNLYDFIKMKWFGQN